MFRVYELGIFAKRARKILSPEQYRELNDIKDNLRENGFIGKPLGPYWLRELKLHNKRIYFLVQEKVILLVDVSEKTNQQKTIDGIRQELSAYTTEMKKLSERA